MSMGILLIFIISSLIFTSVGCSSVFRLRLSNGVIKRVEVDDDVENIADLYRVLRSQYKLLDSDKLEIAGKIFEFLSDAGKVKIASLELQPGEFIRVISSVTTSTYSFETDSRKKDKVRIKSRIQTVADIEKRRKELVKISSQKAPKDCRILVPTGVSRIIQRVSRGGLALLIGTKIDIVPAVRGKIVNSYVASTVKGGVTVPSTNPILTPWLITVAAAIEIFPNVSCDGVSNLVDMFGAMLAAELADALGLSIVGCCIGTCGGQKKVVSAVGVVSDDSGGEASASQSKKRITTRSSRSSPSSVGEGDRRSRGWGATHLLTALQLRALAKHDDPFVVLSATDPEPGGSEDAKDTSTKLTSTAKRRRRLIDEALGLSLEAFMLSDQAISLLEKGAFVDSKNTRLFGTSVSDSSLAINNRQKVILKTPVIIRSEEVYEVDPVLFAVPLPIIGSMDSIASGKSDGEKSGGRMKKCDVNQISDTVTSFDHTFPTLHEILEAGAESTAAATLKQSSLLSCRTDTARKALHFLSSQLSAKSLKEVSGTRRAKLRDPHLLIYLRATYLSGDLKSGQGVTFRALCKTLVGVNNAPPASLSTSVCVALEIIGQTIEADMKQIQGKKKQSNISDRRRQADLADREDDDD